MNFHMNFPDGLEAPLSDRRQGRRSRDNRL